MRTWKMYAIASIAALMLMSQCVGAVADDRPNSLELLKRHPEFVTLTRVTELSSGTAVIYITLCRQKTSNCERFESNASTTDELADYVYLFAVYKGKYAPKKPGVGKTLAVAFLQEAQDSGDGKTLLDYYSGKTDCSGNQDVPRCVLHSLYKSIRIQRYIVEHDDVGGVGIFNADENGIGDPFAG